MSCDHNKNHIDNAIDVIEKSRRHNTICFIIRLDTVRRNKLFIFSAASAMNANAYTYIRTAEKFNDGNSDISINCKT